MILPLCPTHHNDLHARGGEGAFFREAGVQLPYGTAMALWRIHEQGWDRDEAIRAIVGARR